MDVRIVASLERTARLYPRAHVDGAAEKVRKPPNLAEVSGTEVPRVRAAKLVAVERTEAERSALRELVEGLHGIAK